MEENFKMVAKTFYGFEDILSNELLKLGAQKIEKGSRSVSFYGDKGFMYKANLSLRTAIKILKPIRSFKFKDQEDFYNKIYKIDWEKYLNKDNSFLVSSIVFHSQLFNHSKYVSQKVKDAVVDRFRDLFKKRPDVELKYPDLRINIHINRNTCNVSLDSSGESLHKRGYKAFGTVAPINEVLAAGIIMLSGWNGDTDFLDPMCGGGTILIEAAMIACNMAPNLNRNEFAFEKWKDWDEDLFEVNPELTALGDLSFQVKADQFGNTTVDVILSDCDEATCSDGTDFESSVGQSFNININSINDEPAFDVQYDGIIYNDATNHIGDFNFEQIIGDLNYDLTISKDKYKI